MLLDTSKNSLLRLRPACTCNSSS